MSDNTDMPTVNNAADEIVSNCSGYPPGWNPEHQHFDNWELPDDITPRDYQQTAFGDMVRVVDDGLYDGKMCLYVSPTGSGKSVIELMYLGFDSECFLITPRLEIIVGLLEKLGGYTKTELANFSSQKLAEVALAYRICTPVRLKNLLASGEYRFRPKRLIVDEGHHVTAETYKIINAYWPGVTIFLFTATGFRGTNKQTAEFLEKIAYHVNVLTIPQAVQRGVIELPEVEIWPLCDDDSIVEIQNGEFRASAAGAVNQPILQTVAERCRDQFIRAITSSEFAYMWDRPTIFAVPTTDNVWDLVDRLNGITYDDFLAIGITQESSRQERNDAFQHCIRSNAAIVQIDVVSEGVDLPIRRLIDLRPTMSPVKWMQQLGRITRPRGKKGQTVLEPPSHYVCCNRNLERHSYTFQGMIKPKIVEQAQKAFDKPTTRNGARVIGLEGIGRFQAIELPLADGTIGTMYSVHSFDGFVKTEYAILLHPCVDYPLIARKVSTVNESTGEMAWGKWSRIDELPDIKGYQSTPPSDLSKGQRDWWVNPYTGAAARGLNPLAKVNRKNFQALPVLANTGTRLTIGGF